MNKIDLSLFETKGDLMEYFDKKNNLTISGSGKSN